MAVEAEPNGERKAMLIRLPVDIHAGLKRIAHRERRTLHAQTVMALEGFVAEHEHEAAKS